MFVVMHVQPLLKRHQLAHRQGWDGKPNRAAHRTNLLTARQVTVAGVHL